MNKRQYIILIFWSRCYWEIYRKKLKTFIGQLADGNEVSWQFIDEFVDRTEKRALFIQLLAEKMAWNVGVYFDR